MMPSQKSEATTTSKPEVNPTCLPNSGTQVIAISLTGLIRPRTRGGVNGKSLPQLLHSVLQLPLVFGSIEVALRGGDEPVRSNLPTLKATDANPMTTASWPIVSADQRPVVRKEDDCAN